MLELRVLRKYRNRPAVTPLSADQQRVIDFCMAELRAAKGDGLITLTFQSGRVPEQRTMSGCVWRVHAPAFGCYFQWTVHPARMFIYTWRREASHNLHTLAHEFGHLHEQLVTKHYGGDSEDYADAYAEWVLGALGLPMPLICDAIEGEPVAGVVFAEKSRLNPKLLT